MKRTLDRTNRSLMLATGFTALGLAIPPALAAAGAMEIARLEPGLQGQSLPADNPGSILEQPYMKGVRVLGHDLIRARDSNVQLTWVDHCAYVSSTGGPFPIVGTAKGDPALIGVAVIDVRDPRHPKTVKLLRDRGSMAALETMHAVSSPDRKVLAAGAYHGGPNAAGTSGSDHDPDATAAWLDIYDVSDCADPKLMAEVKWPENSHTIRVSPDGRLVYGTNMSPFTGGGGLQVMDISDLAHPKFLGKFGVTRADGTTFEFASHELSFSADGRRIYAGVNSSRSDDLNQNIKISPPNREALGVNGGGIYILDNSDFIARRPDPKLRLIGAMPGGGWHSVMPANIGGVPYLVGGSELGACPGTWPRFTNIADETKPFIAGEFRLAMNRAENCPTPTAAEKATSGIVGSSGTAALHFNDVDSATNTRWGLFQFLWAGLRIVDLNDPARPVEVAYFKPGDACGGHVRYLPESGQIWLSCGQSGFYVLELAPEVRAARAATGASASAGAVVSTDAVLDLASTCQTDVVQSAVAMLSPAVTVKQVSDPGGPTLTGGAKFTAATSTLGAYCQVTGSFVTNPKTGKTANFLATFPANWNGKYLQMGCSGHCGMFAVSNPAVPLVTITNQGYPGQIIQKGYAAFATDQGHEGSSGGNWAVKGPGQVDDDYLDDYYYRADQVLAHLGKEFTVAFYTQALQAPQKIARSYFSGCSGGGRDAFVAASYFPEEFDGIVGGSAYNLVGAAFQAAAIGVATLQSTDALISPALLKSIDPIVKLQCDKLDGVEDGLVQNPMACNFRPDRDLPRCVADKPGDQCFTQAQINTLSVIVNAVTDEDGKVIQPGYSVTELNPGFMPRPKDSAAPDPWPELAIPSGDNGLWGIGDATLKIFVHKNDPEFHTRSVVSFLNIETGPVKGFHAIVPKQQVAAAMTAARMGVGHFPENADQLIKLNRKFLLWHNLSDEKLTPYMSINYYKQLAKRHGGYAKLQNNVRLFSIPGSSHCSMSGVGPNNFDALTAIEDWVEKDKEPDALPASLYNPHSPIVDISKQPLRTMPLCKFPEQARYSGKGDVKDAANWRCPANDRSMLRVGESGRQAGVIESRQRQARN